MEKRINIAIDIFDYYMELECIFNIEFYEFK